MRRTMSESLNISYGSAQHILIIVLATKLFATKTLLFYKDTAKTKEPILPETLFGIRHSDSRSLSHKKQLDETTRANPTDVYNTYLK